MKNETRIKLFSRLALCTSCLLFTLASLAEGQPVNLLHTNGVQVESSRTTVDTNRNKTHGLKKIQWGLELFNFCFYNEYKLQEQLLLRTEISFFNMNMGYGPNLISFIWGGPVISVEPRWYLFVHDKKGFVPSNSGNFISIKTSVQLPGPPFIAVVGTPYHTAMYLVALTQSSESSIVSSPEGTWPTPRETLHFDNVFNITSLSVIPRYGWRSAISEHHHVIWELGIGLGAMALFIPGNQVRFGAAFDFTVKFGWKFYDYENP